MAADRQMLVRRLERGDRVVVDHPVLSTLHGKPGTISHAYGLQQDSWWVTMDHYPPDAGPLWFRGSEIKPLETS